MQFPYIKMETNGHSWILIQDETIDKSIPLETLAKTICHTEYGVGGLGIIVIDHAFRPIPMLTGYNKSGHSIKIEGDALRVAASHLMTQYNQPQLKVKVADHVYFTEKKHGSVAVSYNLPESHTEQTLYSDGTPVVTYSTTKNQHFIIMSQSEVELNFETLANVMNRNFKHSGCIIEQNTPLSLSLTRINELNAPINPTDTDICSAITILRNKNKLKNDTVIDLTISGGRIQVLFNYDSIQVLSKVYKIASGNYFYSTHLV